MVAPVAIRINLSTGQLEIEAAEESLEGIFAQVRAILPELANAASHETDAETNHEGASVLEKDPSQIVKERENARPRRRPKQRRDDQNSSVRLGSAYYKNFQPFDLNIGDKKEVDLLEFYKTKSPSNNTEKILVVLYKLTEYLGRNVSYDDLYMGFRIVGEKKPPQNMSAAMGTLVGRNYAQKEKDGIRLKIQGSDFVENNLPNNGDT